MHAADTDNLPPPRRPLRRRAGAVRAARVLVRQLDWLDWPIVWWGGSPPASTAAPPPAPLGDTSAAVAARLSGRPRGAHAVRIVAAAGEPDSADLDTLLRSTAPTISEVLPVDDALVARSLRRLLRSKQFPRVMPQIVGDPEGWRADREEALKRVRPVMLSRKPTAAEVLAIECTCVWLGPDAGRASATLDAISLTTLARDVGAAAFARGAAIALGQRKLAATVPPALRPFYRCGRALPAWPLDVIGLAADAVGPDTLSAAADACSHFATVAGAAFVREALLAAGPGGARRAVENYPHFARLIDTLCEEPLRRLGRMAAAQQEAVAAAVAESGVMGAVAEPEATSSPERWAAVRLFLSAHADAVDRVLSGEPAADRLANLRPRRTPYHGGGGRRKPQLQHALAARKLWDHFFGTGTTEMPALTRRVEHILHDPALTFDALPAVAAKLLWDAGEPALRQHAARVRGLLWALAAHLDVEPASDWHAAAAAWADACRDACRPGPGADAHAQAAFVPLLVLFRNAMSPADAVASAEVLRALAAAAPAVTAGWAEAAWTAAWWKSALTELRHVVDCSGRVVRAGALRRVGAASGGAAPGDALGEMVRRGWLRVVDAVASRRPERVPLVLRWLRRLDENSPPFSLANAALLVDARLTEALLDAVVGLQDGDRATAVRWVVDFALGVSSYEALNAERGDGGAVSRAVAAREAFLLATPAALSSVRDFATGTPGGDAHRLAAWDHCATVAFAWSEEGYAGAAGVFAALARRCLEPGGDYWRNIFYHDCVGRLRVLVTVTAGDAERLTALHRVPLYLDYREFDQMLHAWHWVRGSGQELRERFGEMACTPATATRTIKLLARLGLCLQLHRADELRRRVGALAAEQNLPPDAAAELDALGVAEPLRRDLRVLCAARGGTVPRSVEAVVNRRALLEAELKALARRGPGRGTECDERRRLREQNVARYLANADALRQWVEADLRKLLVKSLADAVLGAAEMAAEEIVLSHVTSLVGGPPPAAYDKRNWDNALRLYFTAEHNRGTLRRLLRGEATGDRSWLSDHPANRRFLDTVAARGVDVGAWRGVFERTFETPAGRWTVALETDPLHVLQMGNYFETCLSADGCNAFATIANACEADKRVAYVRDARGVIVGRKLLVMTPEGRIVGFRSYGAGALDAWDDGGAADGADRAGAWVKIVLDAFCRELADYCRAKLHPLRCQGRRLKDVPAAGGRGLFCHWYNDGPEPFDPPWLRHSPARLRRQWARGGRARVELEALKGGDATQRAAAHRVLLWLGADTMRPGAR